MTPPRRRSGPLAAGSTLAAKRTIKPPHCGLPTLTELSCATAKEDARRSSVNLAIDIGTPDDAHLNFMHGLEFRGTGGGRCGPRADDSDGHPHEEHGAGKRNRNGDADAAAEKQNPPRPPRGENALIEGRRRILHFPFAEQVAKFGIIGWF